jgi:hypothetical protein
VNPVQGKGNTSPVIYKRILTLLLFIAMMVGGKLNAQNIYISVYANNIRCCANNDSWTADDCNFNFTVDYTFGGEMANVCREYQGDACFDSGTDTWIVNGFYLGSLDEFVIWLRGWEDDDGNTCNYYSGDDDYYSGWCNQFTVSNLRNGYAPNTWYSTTQSWCGQFRADYMFYYSYEPVTSITGGGVNTCQNVSRTLTAIGGGANTQWYSGSCGGTSLGTGASISVSPTVTTTYYARNPGGSCASTTVTVSPYTANAGTDISICGTSATLSGSYSGSLPATCTTPNATTPTYVYVWYGTYSSESSWSITNSSNAVVLSGANCPSNSCNNSVRYDGYVNLAPGNYTFRSVDSYGDGWDGGGYFRVFPNGGVNSGNIYPAGAGTNYAFTVPTSYSNVTCPVTYGWTGPSFSSALQNPSVTQSGTYTLTVTSGSFSCTDQVVVALTPVPSNDVCSSSNAITVTTGNSYSVATTCASQDGPIPTCQTVGANYDLWYKFVAPSTGNVTFDFCTASYDSRIAAFTGTCGSFTEVGCSDDNCGLQSTIVSMPVCGGTTYYLSIGGYNGSRGTGTLMVTFVTNPITFSSVTTTSPGCNGGTGQINITASGGSSGSLTFSANGVNGTYGGSPITGLAAGSYTVYGKDGNGCTQVYGSSVVISQPSAINITAVTPSNPTCNGGTGQIAVTANGGTGVLAFSSTGTGGTFGGQPMTGLVAGSYYVAVRDANNCTVAYTSNPVVLTQPTPVVLSGTAYVSCPGVNGNTTVRLNAATGGSGSGYQYKLVPGSFGGTNTFSVPNNTTAYFDARDGAGCQTATSLTVVTTAAPTAIATSTTTSITCPCEGENRSFWIGNGSTAIGQINPGTNNIGNVSFKACVQGAPYLVYDGTYSIPQDTGKTAVMGRSLEATFTAPSNGTVQITFPFTAAQVSALASASTSSSSANDLVTSIADVKVTRMEGILHNCTWNTTGLLPGGRTGITPGSQPSVLGNPSVSFATTGNSVYFFHGSASNTPLPISMLSQGAKCSEDDSHISIQWVTATEINNDTFIVERSPNLVDWSVVCGLDGAGNSNTTRYYACKDEDPILKTQETWYYRITQVDNNGEFETFAAMPATCNLSGMNDDDRVSVFPNPASDRTTVQTLFDKDEHVSMTIITATGQQIEARQYYAGKGTTQVTVDTGALPIGNYFIVLQTTNATVTKPLIISR